MQIYLVGGAVRDKLLNLDVQDHDYVIVDATADQLLNQGFTRIGKEFPVFLHPDTGTECALARIEDKTGSGYSGFSCRFGPEFPLEIDLMRRDLTINAIAQSSDGQLIDPYHGQTDLRRKVLRHVSPAFIEDPLRVLRTARFAARFAHMGFHIAHETLYLMQQITYSGELNTLTPERIWKEIEKALRSNSPQVFFKVLRKIGALRTIVPELDALFGVPSSRKWYSEFDTGIHTLSSLKQATQLSSSVPVRFAALCHDFGKASTPPALWPHHPEKYGKKGAEIIELFCQRLKIPNLYRDLAILTSIWHFQIQYSFELTNPQLLELLDKCDSRRRPERFAKLLLACESHLSAHPSWSGYNYLQRQQLGHYCSQLDKISVQAIIQSGFVGKQIRQKLNEQRLALLEILRTKEAL